MRTWDEAWEILKDIPTDDYISGKWPDIRVNKVKALFELAHEVKPGTCIVDLGTWRGLAAFTLALGSDDAVKVYTLDDYGDRRVEEVADVKLRYNPADLVQFRKNLSTMPDDIKFRIKQVPVEIREAADTWTEPAGLVFWDIWGERLIDDIRAWVPHVVEGGLVVVKVFEDGRLHHERLYALPGLKEDKAYPEGVIYTMRRVSETTDTAHAIWIVDGDKYVAEAGRSAASVQRHMPHLTRSIYQPAERRHKDWFIESTGLLVKVLESLPDGAKVLWLDSDTFMLEPVPELFEMLDRFDMVLAHAPGHQTAPTNLHIPAAFPELNIGVIAMRNYAALREMWRIVYQNQIHGIATDQAALRETLWADGWAADDAIVWCVMPWEYNCRWQIGTFLRESPKILHGHAGSAEEYEQVARQLNEAFHVFR
jgi:predicted O-methyltransferase YrrM